MFTNLVESSSHAKEFKRRGSFVLFTTVTYGVLMVVMGVVSIYAYDARLEEQNLEMVVQMIPVDIAPKPAAKPEAQPQRPRSNDNNNESNVATRTDPMLSVNRPESVPVGVSSTPNTNPPIPDSGLWTVGRTNTDPSAGGAPSLPGTGRQVATPAQRVEIGDPPPLEPEKPKTPKVIYKGPITGEAISLPRPNYPPMAKQINIQGAVTVQVLIDESGRVISAKALSGHPLLINEAQKAALLARFSPTVLNDVPVRVSGMITYNFVLNR
ncbi:MAG TPA: energy transducer TonB [Pyrinomonadaceae bacterium]|nr:energy transducer TonB [Pyrinomonadaceae bacterium]